MARGESTPMDEFAKEQVAKNIERLLTNRNKKQIDLHKATGIPQSTLVGYTKGERLPNAGNVQRIADFFGVRKSEIDPRYSNSINTFEEMTSEYSLKKEPSNTYYYYPHSISAGFPIMTDSVTQFDHIDLPDVVMGKYAGEKNILIMRINGESMNRVIPNSSLIGIKSINISDLKDGDIVVYSHQHEYSVKQFYRRNKDVIFKPLSEDPTFTDYVVNESDSDLIIHGKVVIYIVEK